MPTAEGGLHEVYPCAHLCRKACSNKLIPAAQAARNCALAWFDQRNWTGTKARPRWMGLPPRLDIDERGAEPRPVEEVEHEGCPGSWYRTPFVESVLRYRRRPTEGGGRVPNPFLERCQDELVFETIQLMEAYEDSWHGEHVHQIRLSFDRKGAHG